MLKLDPTDYGTAAGLLDSAPFNVLMAKAVVAGRVRGEVFVDSLQPTSVFIKHMYGMSWLIGYSDSDAYRAAVAAHCSNANARRSSEWLQVYPLDWTELLDPLVATGSVAGWRRTNFWFNQTRFLTRFPEPRGSSTTTPCTASAVRTFPGSVIPGFFWNSIAEFAESGFGYFSTHDDGEIAAIAFSSYLDETHLEIGVETLPEFRGRGHAQAACARLIHHCIEHTLIPVWSCRTGNEGSYRLAEKVGFVPVLEFPYYELAGARPH